MAQLRRKDKALDNETTLQVLQGALYGTLATCGPEGPYAVPVNYVFSGGCIYFHCARQGQKLDNIALEERACFTVVEEGASLREDLSCNYRCAMAFGTVKEVTEKEEVLRVLRLLCQKYYGGCTLALEEGTVVTEVPHFVDRTAFSAVRVFCLSCTRITGKGWLGPQEG